MVHWWPAGNLPSYLDGPSHFLLVIDQHQRTMYIYWLLSPAWWRYLWCLLYHRTKCSWYYGFSIAAASARRPWRREHSNSKNIQPISFKFYMRVITLLLKLFDTLRALEPLRSQRNDTLYPQIFKMQYLHKLSSDCFQIWHRGEVPEATWKKWLMTRLSPKLHSWWHFYISQIFKMQYLHNQLSICFKIWYMGKVSEATYNTYTEFVTTLLYPPILWNVISPNKGN